MVTAKAGNYTLVEDELIRGLPKLNIFASCVSFGTI
jgi:hypothetical protein